MHDRPIPFLGRLFEWPFSGNTVLASYVIVAFCFSWKSFRFSLMVSVFVDKAAANGFAQV